MKKSLAVLLALVVMMVTVAVSVGAETATFKEKTRTQTGKTVGITYESPNGQAPIQVVVGGTVCPVSVEGPGMISVSLNSVPMGVYTKIVYDGVSVSGSPLVVEGSGSLAVTLEVDVLDNGKVIVTATDENEMPVANYQLDLTVGSMSYRPNTGTNGKHQSPYTLSAGDTVTVTGMSTVYTYGGYSVTYASAAQVTEQYTVATTATTTTGGATTTTTVSEGTTTTAQAETTTTVEQQAGATTGTTVSTTATVKGDSTTALNDGMVATNAMTDTALLEAFGLTRQEFLSKARLLVSEADYTSLVGRTGNVPMLSVRTSTAAITPAMVQAALTNVSDFSGYAEDQRQVMTFDLSLLLFSRAGKEVPVTALPEGVLYTVQLPVPTAMKQCTAFAITVMDGDRLMTPQAVAVKNGMFELKINSLEAYTLIGFGEEEDNGAGGLSWRLIVLLIAGILLIAGAGVLLYFFVIRKPDAEEEEQIAPLADTDTDIFSGRTDVENVWEPEDN